VTFESSSIEEERQVVAEIGRRLSDVQFEFA